MLRKAHQIVLDYFCLNNMPSDHCIFPGDGIWRTFMAFSAAWTGCFLGAMKLIGPPHRAEAIICLLKNCVVASCSVGLLIPVLQTPEWTIREAQAALAENVAMFFLTFEWVDLIVFQLTRPSIDWSLVAHHLAYGILGIRMSHKCEGRVVSIMLMVQECSSVFLNIRSLTHKGSVAHRTSTVAFGLLFIVLRGIMGFVPTVISWYRFSATSDATLVTLGYLLQLHWSRLIVLKARRAEA